MALTPSPALWKTPLSFIPVLGFGVGEVRVVTAPSREGRAGLKETGKEIKDKRRRCSSFLLQSPDFSPWAKTPFLGGFQGDCSGLLTQSGPDL